jgi:hypothetical protein
MWQAVSQHTLGLSIWPSATCYSVLRTCLYRVSPFFTFLIFNCFLYFNLFADHSGRCGLRHELSSLARTLGMWVRIPLKAWMSVYIYSVSVVLCVGSGLPTGWSPSKESYRLCNRSRNWKIGQGPTKGCRAIIIITLTSSLITSFGAWC